MKTLCILLLGLASSLLPFKCATAGNAHAPQHVAHDSIAAVQHAR